MLRYRMLLLLSRVQLFSVEARRSDVFFSSLMAVESSVASLRTPDCLKFLAWSFVLFYFRHFGQCLLRPY